VAHDRLAGDELQRVHRVRAHGALTSFLNGLSVSLFALIPGVGRGWTGFVVSISGLLFVLASLLAIRRARHESRSRRRTSWS
jgi:hypothetical protein